MSAPALHAKSQQHPTRPSPRQSAAPKAHLLRPVRRIALVALACSLSMPAAGLAQPTVNTRVVNDASQAVPVHIVTPPAAREVLCRLNVNGGSSAGPFFNLGVTTQQTSVTCPDGVSRVDVKQVAFSPDVGNASALSAASFRMTVGFQQPTGPGGLVCPPAGIVAILTNGSPRATVMQPFQLDTSGAAQTMVCFKAFSTSGIAGHGTDFRGTVFFIGTEVR